MALANFLLSSGRAAEAEGSFKKAVTLAPASPLANRALVAFYGVEVGCEATADALALAWERWDSIEAMTNPIGYLFRVGQSRSRRYRRRMLCSPRFPIPSCRTSILGCRTP